MHSRNNVFVPLRDYQRHSLRIVTVNSKIGYQCVYIKIVYKIHRLYLADNYFVTIVTYSNIIANIQRKDVGVMQY